MRQYVTRLASTAFLLVRRNKALAALGVVCAMLGALSAPAIGVLLAASVQAILRGQAVSAALSAGLVGVLAIVQLTAGHFFHQTMTHLGEQAELDVDRELISIVHSSPTLAQAEDSVYLDRIALVRDELPLLPYVVMGVIQASAVLVQIIATVTVLGSAHRLLLLLPIFAVAPLAAGRLADRLDERARQRTAESQRLLQSIIGLALDAGPAKEVRIFGAATELRSRQASLFDETARTLSAADRLGTLTRTAGQVVFAAAYVAGLTLTVRAAIAGDASIGDVILAALLARQLGFGVNQLQALADNLQTAQRIGERLNGLRPSSEVKNEARKQAPVPDSLRHDISLKRVSFQYPGTSRFALQDINLTLPSGSVVALVGENGAGKSSIVKLLCRLYEPTSGEILVDGVKLTDLDADQWRSRIAVVFQDYCRLEFAVHESIGAGNMSRMKDRSAIVAAVKRSGAHELVANLPQGLETLIGRSFPTGTDLSGGQWQRLALSRGNMRPDALVTIVDEPTASLDPASEHSLFEAQALLARETARRNGAVTFLISHRLAGVRTADLIVVLAHGRVAEVGTHLELMRAGRHYAELFRLQADRYR